MFTQQIAEFNRRREEIESLVDRFENPDDGSVNLDTVEEVLRDLLKRKREKEEEIGQSITALQRQAANLQSLVDKLKTGDKYDTDHLARIVHQSNFQKFKTLMVFIVGEDATRLLKYWRELGPEYQKELKNLESDMLRTKMHRVEEELREARQSGAELGDRLELLNVKMEEKEEQVSQLSERLEAKEDKISLLERTAKTLRETKSDLARRTESAEKEGLKLNSHIRHLSDRVQRRDTMIKGLNVSKDQVAAEAAVLRQEIGSLREAHKIERSRLEAAVLERDQQLEGLKVEIDAKETIYSENLELFNESRQLVREKDEEVRRLRQTAESDSVARQELLSRNQDLQRGHGSLQEALDDQARVANEQKALLNRQFDTINAIEAATRHLDDRSKALQAEESSEESEAKSALARCEADRARRVLEAKDEEILDLISLLGESQSREKEQRKLLMDRARTGALLRHDSQQKIQSLQAEIGRQAHELGQASLDVELLQSTLDEKTQAMGRLEDDLHGTSAVLALKEGELILQGEQLALREGDLGTKGAELLAQRELIEEHHQRVVAQEGEIADLRTSVAQLQEDLRGSKQELTVARHEMLPLQDGFRTVSSFFKDIDDLDWSSLLDLAAGGWRPVPGAPPATNTQPWILQQVWFVEGHELATISTGLLETLIDVYRFATRKLWGEELQGKLRRLTEILSQVETAPVTFVVAVIDYIISQLDQTAHLVIFMLWQLARLLQERWSIEDHFDEVRTAWVHNLPHDLKTICRALELRHGDELQDFLRGKEASGVLVGNMSLVRSSVSWLYCSEMNLVLLKRHGAFVWVLNLETRTIRLVAIARGDWASSREYELEGYNMEESVRIQVRAEDQYEWLMDNMAESSS